MRRRCWQTIFLLRDRDADGEWMERRNKDSAPRSLHSLLGTTTFSTFPDIKSKPFRINHVSIENLNKSMNGSNKNTPFSFSTLPDGTLARPLSPSQRQDLRWQRLPTVDIAISRMNDSGLARTGNKSERRYVEAW